MKKSTDPRKPRTYKAREEPYQKAMKRAEKQNRTLVGIIEDVIEAYAKGEDIWSVSKQDIMTLITDKQ